MKTRLLFAVALAVCVFAPAVDGRAASDGPGLLVTVNDFPITSFDVEQRMRLNVILGRGQGSVEEQRKRALQAVIDDEIKLTEARKYKAEPTEQMVNDRIDKMAKGSKTTLDGLAAQLKAKGVSMSTLKRLISAQIAFNRMLMAKYRLKAEIDPAEVDKKYQEMVNDPRLQPITVYEIMEIEMPLDSAGDVMQDQLFFARAADAAQFRKAFKGCNSARQAASGIFNVRIGKRMEADGRRIPKRLKEALDKSGPGSIIGPARSKTGIQLVAFCGKKNLAPEKPTREQVETVLANKKFDVYEERYMRELRRNAYIEYKDAKATE
jgi:peptidyl-prolyl cis-trans isomerase SurA